MEHLLFEHIGGLEIFEIKEFEDLAITSFNDYMALTQAVNHVSSLEFNDSTEALEIIRNLENGIINQQVENFLKINNVKILHCDKSLKKSLGILQITHKYSPNIIKGIKFNLKKIIKKDMNKQLMLSVSHQFSKENIKFDMEREDNIVISTGYELDHLEQEILALHKKISKMISWYFPEFNELLLSTPDFLISILNKDYDSCNLPDKITLEMFEIFKDVRDEIPQADLDLMISTVKVIFDKSKLSQTLEKYLAEKMTILTPNLRQILGDRLCFKLLHKAGGLRSLSLCPSSTLQLLGAEKALFMSLKRKSRTPKYGLLYQLSYLKKNKGRIARYIASKCSLAARIDCFSPDRTDMYGKEMMKLINNKIKSNNSGINETSGEVMKRVKSKLECNK